MFKIVKKEQLNNNVALIEVLAPDVAKKAQAGQFIILRAEKDGERIPLTISDYDRLNGTVTVIYQIVGATTRLLNSLNQGDFITDFVGPLGNKTETDGVKKVAVIGGGVGCAIAYPISKKFHEMGVDVTSITGFRNADIVILEDKFKKVSNNFVKCSDDGSWGEKGLVTNALEKLILNGEKFDRVYAIGPIIMMKFVCQVTKKYNIPTIVSMNPIMIDGTGMCGGCRLTVGGKMKFACVDGPDFDGHLVDFDEAMKRTRAYYSYEREYDSHVCNLLKKGEN